jgi:hypothetical protein
MNISNLVPVSSLVQRFGVKAVLYGGPGLGKTPMLTTAPNPVILFTEPGFLSVRHYNGPGCLATSYKDIREFWQWAIGSQEARQFQTKCVDSLSQMAEIILNEELPKHKDGRKAYGEMSQKVMEILNWIYYAPNFHSFMLAKEMSQEKESGQQARPYFPGQDLNIKVPHLFDSVWRIELFKAPDGKVHKVIRTRESYSAFARDRSGNLNELEPPDIGMLFNKSLQ